MVKSSLVEPLVAPLVQPLVGGRRRGGVVRSRLARTALMMSAVMVVATAAEPDAVETRTRAPSPTVERNAHRPPAPIPLRDVARVFGHAKAVFEADRATPRIGRPGLAPRFEWDAVWAARLEHERARPWTNLVQGRWRDHLSRSRPPTYAMFGSGRHRSGPAGPRISLGLPAAA